MPCQRRFIWFVWVAAAAGGFSSSADAQVDGNPFTGPEVEICGPEVPMDGVGVGAFWPPVIDGDILTVGVGYSCGCAEHFLGGCWTGEFSDSAPVETDLDVAHDANGEGCEAACIHTIELDLTPIADAYHDAFGPEPGTVLIHLRSYVLEYSVSRAVPVESSTWTRIKAWFR